ncbi:MAG: ankyrin repeat domain-containing protein [Alphaproteobacteria bacterium]
MTGTLSQLASKVFGKQQPAPSLSSQLLFALQYADFERVKDLCGRGVDVNADNAQAFTNIATAARDSGKAQDALDCFKALLGHGFSVETHMKQHIYQNVPSLAPAVTEVQDALSVRQSLAAGDAVALRGLLARGVDFDIGLGYGAPPAIITAARRGTVEVIDLLLAHGASPNTKIDRDSSTMPLHQAAMHGKRDAFVRLLDAGADATLIWSNSDGFWTVNGMAKKCKSDPGMAKFVESVLDARNADTAPEVSVKQAISIRRPIAFKS